MFCKNCGAKNADGVAYCTSCGLPMHGQAAQQPYEQPAVPVKDAGKGNAVASLVLGIISLLLFPAITGTLAIVLSRLAKKKGSNSKLATAGLVLGIIGIVSWILMLFI